MKSMEFSGKTTKEAISRGVAEMGCTTADVEIEILELGTPGLFGLFGKPAKVRLTMKKADDDLNIEMPVFTLNQPGRTEKASKATREPRKEELPVPAEAAEEKKSAPAEKTEDRPRRDRKKRKDNRDRAQEQKEENKAAERSAEVVLAPAQPQEPFVETPEDQLSDTAREARAFLTGITERMGVPAEIAVMETEEQLRMVLSGENMSIIIGRRGETLDAIQYLTSLHVNRGREDYLRVSLDTENYRAKREEALRKLAVRMAARCKKNGRRVALEPMNPYERRILHSALQADPDVTTHSEGEEPYRRVIITLN